MWGNLRFLLGAVQEIKVQQAALNIAIGDVKAAESSRANAAAKVADAQAALERLQGQQRGLFRIHDVVSSSFWIEMQ